MKRMRVVMAALAFTAVTAGAARGQAFGGQLSWGNDTDLGIGARLELGLTNTFTQSGPFSRTFFIGSFDLFFPKNYDYMELNANIAVPITASTVDPYVGGGLNWARVSVDTGTGNASSSDLGLNLLGGLRFNLGTMAAFTEGRLELGGGDQFVITFGVLLGGAR